MMHLGIYRTAWTWLFFYLPSMEINIGVRSGIIFAALFGSEGVGLSPLPQVFCFVGLRKFRFGLLMKRYWKFSSGAYDLMNSESFMAGAKAFPPACDVTADSAFHTVFIA